MKVLRQAPFSRAEAVFRALHEEGHRLPDVARVQYGIGGRCGGPPTMSGMDAMHDPVGFFVKAATRLDAPFPRAVGTCIGRWVRLGQPDGPRVDLERLNREWDGELATAASALGVIWGALTDDEQDKRILWLQGAQLAGLQFHGDGRVGWLCTRTMHAVCHDGTLGAFAPYWRGLL